MNIRIVELEDNYEKTKFCGVNLLPPCTESNAALAINMGGKTGIHLLELLFPVISD